jgi:hypothetical protein
MKIEEYAPPTPGTNAHGVVFLNIGIFITTDV